MMPVYAFICTGCGPFEVWRPVTSAAAPVRCPRCDGPARRVFTPPGLALLATPMRRALEEEHRSAHEPDVVTQRRGSPLPHGHEPAPPWVLSH
jgi:putative FmdB family regulatory protein